jgi:hypothetical protein
MPIYLLCRKTVDCFLIITTHAIISCMVSSITVLVMATDVIILHNEYVVCHDGSRRIVHMLE